MEQYLAEIRSYQVGEKEFSELPFPPFLPPIDISMGTPSISKPESDANINPTFPSPSVAVPYHPIPFYERVVMVDEEHMQFWDRDVIVWPKGSLQDEEFMAKVTIRDDNPLKSSIQVPFTYRCGCDDTLLRRAIDRGEELLLIERYFGKDIHCQDWVPACRLDYYPRLQFNVKSRPSDFETVKPMAARFVVALGLAVDVWIDICDCRFDPVQCLFDPLILKDQPIAASNAARFRANVIWPLFKSVQVFWECVESLLLESKEYAFMWPESAGMSVPQLRDYLMHHFPADQDIIKLTYALEAIHGGNPSYTFQITGELDVGYKSHHLNPEISDWLP